MQASTADVDDIKWSEAIYKIPVGLKWIKKANY